MERGKEREEAWSFDGASDGKRTAAKESEENKENLILNAELKDDLLLYQDEEALNDSVISGEQRVGLLGREPRSSGMEPKRRFEGSAAARVEGTGWRPCARESWREMPRCM